MRRRACFYPGVENLFNKAGSAGIWLHFLTQSLADIDNVIGREPLLDPSAVTKLAARQFFAFIMNSANFKGKGIDRLNKPILE